MERGLDPARRFERDAVGRERVSRPRRAVPAAPDGLGRPFAKALPKFAFFNTLLFLTPRSTHLEYDPGSLIRPGRA